AYAAVVQRRAEFERGRRAHAPEHHGDRGQTRRPSALLPAVTSRSPSGSGLRLSCRPPSTGMIAPVMNAEASEARNATTSATSSGVPARPSRVGGAPSSPQLLPPSVAKVDDVLTTPGATALTRTPHGPSSTASALVAARIPPLVVTYGP